MEDDEERSLPIANISGFVTWILRPAFLYLNKDFSI